MKVVQHPQPAQMNAMSIGAVFAFILACAWLVHNHYAPWRAFHSDIVAAFGLGMAAWGALRAVHSRRIDVPLPAIFLAVLALVPAAQFGLGLIYFAGDAWITSLYLLGAALAIQLGFTLRRCSAVAAEPLAWSMLVTGLMCVGIALYQWLQLEGLGILAEGLSPDSSRAYANFGQPNQYATFLLFALASSIWLFEKERFGPVGLVAIACMLALGIALAQSRTAYLGVVTLAALHIGVRRRATLKVTPLAALAIAGAVALAAAALPLAADLRGGTLRSAAEHASVGARPIHWAALADAVWRSPWIGYGWNQLPVAIAAVVDDHRASQEFIHHAHNLLLDLFVWNGIVLGGVIIVVGAWWMLGQLRSCKDAEGAFAIMVLLALLVHSMFEYPFAYAYFLLPAMYCVGVLQAKNMASRAWATPRWSLGVVFAAATALTCVVAIEYMRFEENFRELRFEASGVGSIVVSPESPTAHVLTQLLALNRFARREAQRNLSSQELAQARRVAERFGAPQVLFRYAVTSGINGQPAEAARSLRRLCKLYPQSTCDEGRDNWASLAQTKFPELAPIPFPVAH
jgi:O-antigen ligase